MSKGNFHQVLCSLPLRQNDKPSFSVQLMPSVSFEAGQLVMFGGIQSSGRTLTMLTLMNEFVFNGHSVCWISNTERGRELALKLLAIKTSTPYSKLRNELEIGKEMAIEANFGDCSIFDNCYNWKDCRKYIENQSGTGVKVFFIDALTSLIYDDSPTDFNEKLDNMAREFKILATELDILIIGCSPLGHEIYAREGHCPFIGDLPGSHLFAEMFDTILLFHVPEMYGITEDECGEQLYNTIEIYVGKGRFSASKSVRRFEPYFLEIDRSIPKINISYRNNY